jgi:hypothetical protein
MGTFKKLMVCGAIAVTAAGATAAAAGVPFWANHFRTMRVPVSFCASGAASAIQTVTGFGATATTLNANTRLLRGFTSTAGIFIECSASTTTVCGQPKADLTITVFSDVNEAVTIRDRLSSAIGDPILIDCGSVHVPVL